MKNLTPREVADRAVLEQNALRSCRYRNHDMSFVFRKGPRVRYECSRCQMIVDIDLYPVPNGIQIGGEAVALNCVDDISNWLYSMIDKEIVVYHFGDDKEWSGKLSITNDGQYRPVFKVIGQYASDMKSFTRKEIKDFFPDLNAIVLF